MKQLIPFRLAIPHPSRFPKEITQQQRKSTKVFTVKIFMIEETNKICKVHMPNNKENGQTMVILYHWKMMSLKKKKKRRGQGCQRVELDMK